MATRDELRVRLQADVGPYAGQMQVAERATKAVVDQTKQWRNTALQSTGVAMGLAESMVVVSGSSAAAARGLTAVNVATKALAVTPAGAAMTALGIAAGFLLDELKLLEPEVDNTDERLKELAATAKEVETSWNTQVKFVQQTTSAVTELKRAYNDAWLPREQQLVNELSRLQTIEMMQKNSLDYAQQIADSSSNYAKEQANVLRIEKEYYETLNKRVAAEKELSDIHDKREKEEADRARKRQEAADRELASLIKMAQQRTDAAVKAAQKEEDARRALVDRQVDQLRSQIQTAEERLDLEEAIADSLLEQGRITSEEHRKRLAQLNKERVAIDHNFEDLTRRLEEAAEQRDQAAKDLEDRITMVRDVTNDLLSAGVNTIFDEWKKDLDGAQKVAASLLQTIVQIAQQALVAKIGTSAISGLGGSGGDWPRFATGGLVRGPGTGTSDSVVARVSAGEYVVRAAAVEKVGVGLLEKINSMEMPRFANGGQVGAGGSSPNVSVVVMRSEDELERYMARSRTRNTIVQVVRESGLVG